MTGLVAAGAEASEPRAQAFRSHPDSSPAQRMGPQVAARARSGAELVDWWRREGVIGSRRDISDSSGHARQIRQKAERRGQTE
jgi:hypothetical protein